VTHEHSVPAVGIERAEGLVGDLDVLKGAAAREADRLLERERHTDWVAAELERAAPAGARNAGGSV
jgi:hypothetical protein